MVTAYDAEWIPQLRVKIRGRLGLVVDAWDDTGTGMLAGAPTMLRVEYDDTTVSDEPNTEDVEVISSSLSRPSAEIGWIRRAWNLVYR